MKLYATTTSERASKGQGGNEYLKIQLSDENGVIFGSIAVLPNKRVYGSIHDQKIDIAKAFSPFDIITHINGKPIAKGKQKKGEVCYCTETDLSVPHYSDDHMPRSRQFKNWPTNGA